METIIRLSVALGIFCIMIGWEYVSPRRVQHISRKQRWPVNLGLAAFNMAVMRLSLGGLAYLSAVTAAGQGYGLLNRLAAPEWLSIVATLLFLDFAIYCQHIVSHKWPLLWHLHQVHHTDLEFDATTAVRFHPLEIMISMLYKVLCIVLFGANPWAVIAFEIILNGAATFNHSNINIPPAIDKKLRWLIITPDMHRIHHSTLPAETDSNYGFSISCWDRLCRTYIAEPRQSQTAMAIGLTPFRKLHELGFMQLLLLPFKALRKR
ncbi:sterol desaturase family protein [Methylobacter tundripaludum]|uniref:sterol desaturase family protein n=1 Tax=Methylobacter tundripaludum TaxID=173365 RepID=UPI000486D304|nr:sterol desaturase family protein [Methylobacter tundripaludum]